MADLLRLAMTERDLVHKGFERPYVGGLLAQVEEALGNRGHMIPRSPSGVSHLYVSMDDARNSRFRAI